VDINRVDQEVPDFGPLGVTIQKPYPNFVTNAVKPEVSQCDEDQHEAGASEMSSVNLIEAPSADATVTVSQDTGNILSLTLDPLRSLTFTPCTWDNENAETVIMRAIHVPVNPKAIFTKGSGVRECLNNAMLFANPVQSGSSGASDVQFWSEIW